MRSDSQSPASRIGLTRYPATPVGIEPTIRLTARTTSPESRSRRADEIRGSVRTRPSPCAPRGNRTLSPRHSSVTAENHLGRALPYEPPIRFERMTLVLQERRSGQTELRRRATTGYRSQYSTLEEWRVSINTLIASDRSSSLSRSWSPYPCTRLFSASPGIHPVNTRGIPRTCLQIAGR